MDNIPFLNVVKNVFAAPTVQKKTISSFWSLMGFRIFITLFLIIWGISISILHKKAEGNDQEKSNLEYLTKLWIGESGILIIITYLWIITLLAVMFWPSLKEIISAVNANNR